MLQGHQLSHAPARLEQHEEEQREPLQREVHPHVSDDPGGRCGPVLGALHALGLVGVGVLDAPG